MERLYRVCFDTQRDRQYITWGFFVMARNMNDAKDAAYQKWNSRENPRYSYGYTRGGRWIDVPHMYHTNASRMTEEERNHELNEFFIIDSKHANWGYKKTYFGYW